jgi:hypothetical protein
MFITKKHLSRRTVLRGTGVALALPLLDAMIPAMTALAQTAAAPRLKAGFFYLPHGAIMNNTPYGEEWDYWTPKGKGQNFTLSPILTSLEKYKHYVTSFSELENAACAGSVHSINPATWLSSLRPDNSVPGASMSTTLDQIIARHISQDTPLPSLELAAETTVQAAACGGGSGGCYYSSTLSFQDANTPLPMEYNPRKVFLNLFGEGDTAEERSAVAQQTGSLLDLINERTQDLQKTLGPSDKVLLESYLETVREIERRVDLAASRDLTHLDLPTAPIGELANFDEQVPLMFDLIALAYQAGLTRVASYIMVAEGTNRTYNFIGVPDAFHPLSHHANDKARLEKLVKVQSWHVEKFANFIDKLANMPDGDGSMLDHSLFLYGSNMSNSDRHNNYPLPNIVVGKANGAVTGGQHIELPTKTPLANLHLTLLNRAGIQADSFADSTGMINEV